MTIVTTEIAVGVEALAAGRLVAFPTETVYGLGADAARADAVRRVFEVKGRPLGHPLIVHLASASLTDEWARLDDQTAHRVKLLAEAFWPGPLTIIVPRSERVALETVGGRDTIGLRVPDHPVALELLTALGGGVAAPSANRFGRVSPTTASHVVDDLGDAVDVVIDGGPTAVGVESTIVELVGPEPQLLRPGAVTVDDLAAVLGVPVEARATGEARAPGMLASHYSPRAEVELVTADALDTRPGPATAVIAPVPVDHEPSWVLPADAEGYAAELYATMRAADATGVDRILIVGPSHGALLAAVTDRLTKASIR